MLFLSSKAISSAALLQYRRTTLVPLVADVTARSFGSKKKVKVNKQPKGEDTSRSKDLDLILRALDAPYSKPPPADDEELARRERVHKAYTIGLFKQHNEEEHDLSCKMKLKRHALKMLPKKTILKEKALEIDTVVPPRWRRIPVWTPPIPGFDPRNFFDAEQE